MTRLAFLGSSQESAICLRALFDAGHEIGLVVTAGDKRRGRGAEVSATAVKKLAHERGTPVVHDLSALKRTDLQLGVVVAFGRLVPESLLSKMEFVNLHFSLLPRWRGAAPVERSILSGDEVTGVCLMRLVKELDAGPVYDCRSTPIEPRETATALRSRLAHLGAALLVERLSDLPDSLGEAVPQDPTVTPTYARKIDSAELELDWSRPAVELGRTVRVGRAWTTWRRKRLIVWEGSAVTCTSEAVAGEGLRPGSLVGTKVVTGAGLLQLVAVQEEGRPRRSADEWLRGARPKKGELLGGSVTGPVYLDRDDAER